MTPVNLRSASVAGVASLVGCALFGPEPQTVILRLDRTAFIPAADTVIITVVLRNNTDQLLTVSGSGGCILRYEVRTSTGALLVSEPSICTAVLGAFRIAPNDSLVRSFRWSGQHFTQFGLPGPPLEPGTYELRGLLAAVEGTQQSNFVAVDLLRTP